MDIEEAKAYIQEAADDAGVDVTMEYDEEDETLSISYSIGEHGFQRIFQMPDGATPNKDAIPFTDEVDERFDTESIE